MKKNLLTLATNSRSKKIDTNLSLKTNQIERKISYSNGISLKRTQNMKRLKTMHTSLFNIK